MDDCEARQYYECFLCRERGKRTRVREFYGRETPGQDREFRELRKLGMRIIERE